MPTFLLIGIPIVVAVLLWAILSLPDEEVNEEKPVLEDAPKPELKPFKKPALKAKSKKKKK